MATTQRRLDLETKPTVAEQVTKGFRYLTLDPSPRLRMMREARAKAGIDPTQRIREAWLTVGTSLREALQTARTRSSSPHQ